MELTQVKGNTYVLEGEELIPLYLLGGGKCILLDTGLLKEREDLEHTLLEHGLTPAAILCSHAHIDHCASNRYFQEKYGAQVWLTPEEAGLCRSLLSLKCYFLTLPMRMIREEYEAVQAKYAAVEREQRRLEHTGAAPGAALSALLAANGQPEAPNGARLADLLRRPGVTYEELAPLDPARPELTAEQRQAVEIAVKYDGYIQRQLRQVEEMRRLESCPLPEEIDYQAITGLRLEARQKLARIRPLNLGQAGRVSGVSPADVAVLMVYLKMDQSRQRAEKESENDR